jgi:uncharacterized protein YbbC (DUF1343 family)
VRHSVSTGLDRLLADADRLRSLQSARVALLANPTSVTRSFDHAIDALIRAGVRPVRLFGPEHGLRGEAQDMIAVETAVDPLTGIETCSLYGATLDSLRPPAGSLDGIDLVVIDLQDVGSRYYTYVYTALFVVRECTARGVDVLVLDRPNPIGDAIEGPPVDPGFESFVGALPLPSRHGLTLAEVLRFAAQHEPLEFDVLAASGLKRGMFMDEHDAPWVIPSPNMPTLDTAVVYPGQCLLEGTNLSEGRGTTRPFEIFGAPWIDAHVLRAELDAVGLPGVRFRALSFEPTFQKWARTRCSGLQVHVTDRRAFRPLLTSTVVIAAVRRLFGEQFAWRRDAYEFVDSIPAIDLLFGSARQRELIESLADSDALAAVLQTPSWLVDRVEHARLPDYG